MSKALQLRNLLRQDAMTIAPGAYDCITATLIARAGFPAERSLDRYLSVLLRNSRSA